MFDGGVAGWGVSRGVIGVTGEGWEEGCARGGGRRGGSGDGRIRGEVERMGMRVECLRGKEVEVWGSSVPYEGSREMNGAGSKSIMFPLLSRKRKMLLSLL